MEHLSSGAARGAHPGTVAVAIMAKAPWPGEVKTRLCPPLGAAEAAALYRCFLLDKIAAVRSLANPEHIGHLWGDVLALLVVAGVLAFLTPRGAAAEPAK